MIDTLQDIEIKAKAIENDYLWLLNPIRTAFSEVRKTPFFDWLEQISSPQEFTPVANQIFFHSNTFPKAIGLMLSMIPAHKGEIYKIVAEHAFDEADHHLLLLDWMINHNIVENKEQVLKLSPTIETNNCINLGYQIAMERNIETWLVCINCAIEFCFYQFFIVTSKKMHSLNAGHFYFDTHVEADQFHSIMGLQFLQNDKYTEQEKDELITKSLNSISLWCAMANSWINHDCFPKFNLKGHIK